MSITNQILVFDRALMRQRRNRAAASFVAHSVLFDEMAAQLMDRLADIKRSFSSVLDIGGQSGFVAKTPDTFIVKTDVSERRLKQSSDTAVVADEEFLPFAVHSFDLIISNAVLHWVNDLPGALVQIRKVLKPEGLFLAAMLGGQTLCELRHCLIDAELAVTGGISPRLSPTIELQSASGLLQRANFILPVADSEIITLTYTDIYALMRDLRGMGEANAHLHRLRHTTRRAVFEAAAHLYKERYAGVDGRIPATFEIIFLHGWG